MGWAIVIQEVDSRKWVVLTSGTAIDVDDPMYERDVHIVPVVEDKKNSRFLRTGIHNLKRECCCRPRIQEEVHRRTLVIHSDKVN